MREIAKAKNSHCEKEFSERLRELANTKPRTNKIPIVHLAAIRNTRQIPLIFIPGSSTPHLFNLSLHGSIQYAA